ncbi:uncharacterized protein At5g19025-like [Magnolia sinica]|uniref:uncharacterized protein At5g19025-like n=1 Tax=Magnolia sinica TaxID=86752 RepID=UPI002658DE8A|nr:uncharacterized protein At5g19025-like [Magnolia sinica]
MVDYRSLISSFDSSNSQQDKMANAFSSADHHPKHTNQHQRTKKSPTSLNPLKSPPCERSRSAAVDIVILIAVLVAIGVLVFPSVKLFCHGITQISGATLFAVKDEVGRAPFVYAVLGLGFLLATIAVWGIFYCTSRKCDNPNCRGLREAAEFDIQIETEDCLKNSSSTAKGDNGRGLFELDAAHHRELEAELKKMAPLNGRAILVFRARCGCSVGKMEVWGPKKLRKIKK